MASEQKWIREYELVFVGPSEELTITSVGQRDPLDISFTISYDPKNISQGTMDLRIFGLRESNVAKLTQLGVKVFFSVGYRGQPLTRIFTGDIRKLTVDSTEGKHETKIICLTSRMGSKPLRKSFPEGVTHAERIRDMILEIGELIPELVIDNALKDINRLINSEPSAEERKVKELIAMPLFQDQVDGPYTATDTCLEELKMYLDSFFVDVITHNDALYLVRRGGNFNVEYPVQASLGENLLTPPRRRLDNMEAAAGSSRASIMWELKMLLEPEITPNRIIVSSHVRTDSGNVEEQAIILKAVEVKHVGRYRAAPWYTEVAGTIDSSYIVTSPIKTVAYELENTYTEPTYKTTDPTKPVFRGAGSSGSF